MERVGLRRARRLGLRGGGDHSPTLRELRDSDPNVSPDGQTVTFVRHKVDGLLQALYAVNIDGSHLRKLVPYRYEVAIKHDWAPDGRHIVITTDADYPEGRSPNVATVRPDGSQLRLLTHYRGGAFGAFAGSYSPDGRWIVFRLENLERERYELIKMYPDGSHRKLIARMPFRPRGSDWGHSHRMVVPTHNPSSPLRGSGAAAFLAAPRSAPPPGGDLKPALVAAPNGAAQYRPSQPLDSVRYPHGSFDRRRQRCWCALSL